MGIVARFEKVDRKVGREMGEVFILRQMTVREFAGTACGAAIQPGTRFDPQFIIGRHGLELSTTQRTGREMIGDFRFFPLWQRFRQQLL